ncbi:MAG: LytR/AlgR family response regulator transcription factor [Rhodothermales bacterium]
MLRTLIADDEPPARKRLRRMLKPLVDENKLEIVAEACDGVETLELLGKHEIDLLFLDIRMPELDGFEVLKKLDKDRQPVVIFTTAYDNYALKAFEANAVDYLLKPIDKKRLEESVGRAEQLNRASDSKTGEESRLNKLLDWLDNQEAETAAKDKTSVKESGERTYMRQISIPYRDRILVVPVHRLISAEINEGITRLCILDDSQESPKQRIRQHIVNYTLEQLEEHLHPDAFMRIHRSAIVQVDRIQEMIPWFSGRYKLILAGNHEVIASRERSKLLKERLMVDLKK